MLKGGGMTDLQRKRIFDALMDPVPQGTNWDLLEKLVAEDVQKLEPIIDDMLAEAARTGQPKTC